jgi:hypothetical protein
MVALYGDKKVTCLRGVGGIRSGPDRVAGRSDMGANGRCGNDIQRNCRSLRGGRGVSNKKGCGIVRIAHIKVLAKGNELC